MVHTDFVTNPTPKRTQSYSNYMPRVSASYVWDGRPHAADYLEAEAMQRNRRPRRVRVGLISA